MKWMKTPCPICHKPVDSDIPIAGAKSDYPFCSGRCKLIDLGRWLDGKYQIPVVNDDLDESSEPHPPQRRD